MRPFAVKIWFGSNLGYIPYYDSIESFVLWWDEVIKHFSKMENEGVQELIAHVCWGIWKARNAWVFEGYREEPSETLARISALNGYFRLAKAQFPPRSSTASQADVPPSFLVSAVWVKPSSR